MRILVIGASKGVGRLAIERALARKHEVAAVSRSAISLEDKGLTKIQGDATDAAVLRKALEGAEAVLVTLGRGQNPGATQLYSNFAKTLLFLYAEKQFSIPFIVLTGFGAGTSKTFLPAIPKFIFNTLLKKVYKDKELMESLLTASTLRWEIIRAGMLTNGPLTEKVLAETVLYEGMGMKRISRWDVADFMVKQAENPNLIGKYVNLMGA